MNIKKTAMAIGVAAAMGASGAASAYTAASTGNGSLIVVAWDTVTGLTLVEEVGNAEQYTLGGIATESPAGTWATNGAGLAGLTGVGSGYQLGAAVGGWSTYFGSTTNVVYSVTAADDMLNDGTTLSTTRGNIFRALAFTSNSSPTNLAANGYNPATTRTDVYFGATCGGVSGMDLSCTTSVNTSAGPSGTAPASVLWGVGYGTTTNGMLSATTTSNLTQVNLPGSAGTDPNGAVFLNGAAAVGTAQNFWLVWTGATGAASDLALNSQYGSQFKLDASGCLTYGGGDCSVVPLPAAAWLLMSGIAGIGVVGRRKSAS